MTTIPDTALAGLTRATERLSRAAQTVANSPLTGADNSQALLDATLSLQEYRANAKSLKLERERDEALFDILA